MSSGGNKARRTVGIGLSYVFQSSYFIMNMISMLVYPVSRIVFGLKQPQKSFADQWLLGTDREAQVMTLIIVYMFIKFRRAATYEQFIQQVFTYAKYAFVFLFLLIHPRLAVYYLIYCIILWVVLKNPVYSGPSKILKVQSVDQYLTLISKPGTKITFKDSQSTKQQKNSNKDFSKLHQTLVIFNGVWSDSCYHTFSLWAKWAEKFTTSRLQFIEVDIGEHDNIARQYKVGVSGIAGTLPALILFEDGVECIRFPMLDEKSGQSGYALQYNEKELIKLFDLDKRFMATRDLGLEKKKGTT